MAAPVATPSILVNRLSAIYITVFKIPTLSKTEKRMTESKVYHLDTVLITFHSDIQNIFRYFKPETEAVREIFIRKDVSLVYACCLCIICLQLLFRVFIYRE